MKRKMIVLTGVCLSVIMLTGIIASADMRTGDEKKIADPVEEEFYYNNENREMFTDEEINGGNRTRFIRSRTGITRVW